MGFHPEDSRTDAAHNRAAKEQRVREGLAHAALVFDGDDCVGWCQFGAPDEVPRIKNRAAYEKGGTTSPDWRIACCYFNGALSTYEQLGFTRDRTIGKHRWVVARVVEPRA